jgi:hypothetical protein
VICNLLEKCATKPEQPAPAEASAQVSAGSDTGYEKNQKPDEKVRRVRCDV